MATSDEIGLSIREFFKEHFSEVENAVRASLGADPQ